MIKEKPNKDKGAFTSVGENFIQEGLTKREYFAGLAMQGRLSAADSYNYAVSYDVAYDSVVDADNLLAALEKTK